MAVLEQQDASSLQPVMEVCLGEERFCYRTKDLIVVEDVDERGEASGMAHGRMVVPLEGRSDRVIQIRSVGNESGNSRLLRRATVK